jgi:myo-inositol-1(or 4)-monophosphatase
MVEVIEVAIHIAKRTGERLQKHFQSTGLKTNLKVDRSVVTNADLDADHFISSALLESYPKDLILSEELHTTVSFSNNDEEKAIWIVDPLDGTTNFSLGLHIWGVLLTRLTHGYPDLTVMYFPMIDELYTAQRGQGACLNGSEIKVKPFSKERPLPFFSCCSRTFRLHEIKVPYKPRILGSAAYSFCCVARGIAVLGFDATPKIWDIAGAWLLVEEAGGIIENFYGQPPFPLQSDTDYANQNLTTIAAPSKSLIDKARNHIIPK